MEIRSNWRIAKNVSTLKNSRLDEENCSPTQIELSTIADNNVMEQYFNDNTRIRFWQMV